MLELPNTTIAVQAGTDGVTTYNQITVADASIFRPEQQLHIYAGPEGVVRLSTQTIASISGNVITYMGSSAVILPVGSIVRPAPSVGELSPLSFVHPQGVMIDRIAGGIPQSEKLKFNS